MRDLRIKAPGQPPKFMTHNGGLALLRCTYTPGTILRMRDPETFIVSLERKDGAENLTQSLKDAKTRIECLAVISRAHPDPWAATRRPRPLASTAAVASSLTSV